MKTSINIDNYEAYLLDQMEGNLSPEDAKALAAFLEAHPELKAEAEGTQLYYLEPEETIVFPDKASLKKSTGGKVIGLGWNTRWYQVAAAAAIIGAVAFIWSLQPGSDNSSISPLADQPEIEIQVDTNQQVGTNTQEQTEGEVPANTPVQPEEQTPAPQLPPLRLNMPSQGNTEEIAQTESPVRELPALNPLQRTKIEEVDLIQNQFRTEEIAMYEPVRPADITTEQSNPIQEQGNKLLNTILSNEVARNFLPEAVEDEIPNPKTNKSDDNRIILEVPKKGKQLIDNILNR